MAMSDSSHPKSQPVLEEQDGKYHCGTLAYTKAGLVSLFSWMIWGNLCFGLFESLGGPDILTLYLQENFHVTNFQIRLMSLIPTLLVITMTPIISFKSDRTRSRWGRRIPYMLFTAPFLSLFAVGIGYSDVIFAYLKMHMGSGAFMASLLFMTFLMVGFTFFNEFVGTVYWY